MVVWFFFFLFGVGDDRLWLFWFIFVLYWVGGEFVVLLLWCDSGYGVVYCGRVFIVV